MAILCFITTLFVCHFSCYALAIIDVPTFPSSSASRSPVNEFYLLSDQTSPLHRNDHFLIGIEDNVVTDAVANSNRPMMRNKRSAAAPHHQQAHGFIRLGRDPSYDGYSRKSDKNLIRFGRNESPKTNGFIRFGRSDNSFMRFGRNSEDTGGEAMRFGRRGDKFIRFGRSGGGGGSGSVMPQQLQHISKERSLEDLFRVNNNDRMVTSDAATTGGVGFDASENFLRAALLQSSPSTLNRIGRNGNFIRFGRRDNGFIRLGKKKSSSSSDMDRSGAADVETNSEMDDGISNEFDGYDASTKLATEKLGTAGTQLMATGNDENVSDNREKILSMFETDYM